MILVFLACHDPLTCCYHTIHSHHMFHNKAASCQAFWPPEKIMQSKVAPQAGCNTVALDWDNILLCPATRSISYLTDCPPATPLCFKIINTKQHLSLNDIVLKTAQPCIVDLQKQILWINMIWPSRSTLMLCIGFQILCQYYATI
jgi:hypothetical protein